MANQDFGTGKSLVVLAIVVGCFAILWPKIFYPMMQTAFAMTSPKVDSDNCLLADRGNYRCKRQEIWKLYGPGAFRDMDRPPHLHPGAMNPRMRNSMASDVEDKFHMREGRPFPHPQARQPPKGQPKSGGAMSIIMPIYTVGIIVFFLYTVLKLVFKKPQENEKKPIIKDFHMDPQYRKFMCDQPPTKSPTKTKSDKTHPETTDMPVSEGEAPDLDSKDYEIFKLKKKLEETEEAMNRIMKHMGAMSACLSGMDKSVIEDDNSDVRLRHKGNSKHQSGKSKYKKMNDPNDGEIICTNKRKMLQEDLAKAIMSVAELSMKHSSDELSEQPLLKQKDSADSDEDKVEMEDVEDNSAEDQFESSAEEDISTDEQKINKSQCYANECCDASLEQTEKVL